MRTIYLPTLFFVSNCRSLPLISPAHLWPCSPCTRTQVHSRNLGLYEEGNTLSFEQLQTYFDLKAAADAAARRPEGAPPPRRACSLRQDLLPRMAELVLDSVLSNRDRLGEGAKSGTK